MGREPLHWSERAKLGQPPAGRGPEPDRPLSAERRPRSAERRPERRAYRSADRGAARRPPAGRGVRAGLWIALAVVICAAAGAAAFFFWPHDPDNTAAVDGGAARVMATTTTIPAPPLSLSYESDSLGCSFSYPGDWTEYAPQVVLGDTVNDPTAFLVGDPAGQDAEGVPTESVLFMGRRWPGEVPPSARSVVDGMIADFTSSISSLDTTLGLYEPATDLLINSMQACSWAYRDRATTDPQITHAVVVTSGDGSYVFEFRCPESSLPTSQAVFDAVLVSFRPSAYSLPQEISTPSESPTAFFSSSREMHAAAFAREHLDRGQGDVVVGVLFALFLELVDEELELLFAYPADL